MTQGTLTRALIPNSGYAPARYRIYPAVTGVPAVGVVLTSGAGAWGAYADVIPVAAALAEALLIGFYLDTLGASQVFEVQIADATPTPMTEFRIHPTAITPNLGLIPVGYQPLYLTAAQQVQGRAGGAAAKTIGVSCLYVVA